MGVFGSKQVAPEESRRAVSQSATSVFVLARLKSKVIRRRADCPVEVIPSAAHLQQLIVSAAIHAARARGKDKVVRSCAAWTLRDGADLEPLLAHDPVLNDAPVKLVCARFLIELGKNGGRLARRLGDAVAVRGAVGWESRQGSGAHWRSMASALS